MFRYYIVIFSQVQEVSLLDGFFHQPFHVIVNYIAHILTVHLLVQIVYYITHKNKK